MSKIYDVYKKLHKKKKKILIRSFLYVALLFSVNTYAWFIYFNKFDGNINANVVAWDVSFYDDDTSMDSVSLDISQLYPGMDDYLKEITISNRSDVSASFNYEVLEFNLFGDNYVVSDTLTSDDLINMLSNYFPFSIDFEKSQDLIGSNGGSASFKVSVTWPFESDEAYYKLNELFKYDSSIDYYIYSSGNYVKTYVSASNFDTKVSEGLYVESDDADSYWGEKASSYKLSNPDDPCLSMQINLIVAQQKK